ncbi:unnamed protein product [Mycena citricolor]|uniref:Uncharacterized protein n=1 Tax=Mycena citricolor TaxID=2018698 RepID=A0AAD2Q4E1_9AGAR|nr:unnamed protein product [Mycena citricolor]
MTNGAGSKDMMHRTTTRHDPLGGGRARPNARDSSDEGSDDGGRTTPKNGTGSFLKKVSTSLGFSPKPVRHASYTTNPTSDTPNNDSDSTYTIPTTIPAFAPVAHGLETDDESTRSNIHPVFQHNILIKTDGNPDAIIREYTGIINDAKSALQRLQRAHPDYEAALPEEVQNLTMDVTRLATGRQWEATEVYRELQALRDESRHNEHMAKQRWTDLQNTATQRDWTISAMTRQLSELNNTVKSMTDMLKTTNNNMERIQLTAAGPTTPGHATPTTDTPTAAPTTGPGPTYRPTRKTTTNTTKPTVNNPKMPHHPSRLIINLHGKINEEQTKNQPSQTQMVSDINAELQKHEDSKHLLVTALTWTKNDNAVLLTRADQQGEELAKFAMRFTHLLMAPGQTCSVQLDRKWVKIQVDLVRTGAYDPSPTIYGQETLAIEATRNNPIIDKLKITSPLRWLRRIEDLKYTNHSSIVFAVEESDEATFLLRELKSLAMFGRTCPLRLFANKPPVIQCTRCQRFDHMANKCTLDVRCKLCGKTHTDQEHHDNCTNCKAAKDAGDMDIDGADTCEHRICCVNCKGKNEDTAHAADSRRCPEQVSRYESARMHEKKKTIDKAWQQVRSPGGRRRPTNTPIRAGAETQNRFKVLEPERTLEQQAEELLRAAKIRNPNLMLTLEGAMASLTAMTTSMETQ